jgi:hypothetical protein
MKGFWSPKKLFPWGSNTGRLIREFTGKGGRTLWCYKYVLRAFHDEVLGASALPLDVLEQRIMKRSSKSGRFSS